MPGVATDRAILYVHGGAYTTGSLVTHRRHVAQLSAAPPAPACSTSTTGWPRSTRIPAAVDDAVAAYRWLDRRPAGSPAPGGPVRRLGRRGARRGDARSPCATRGDPLPAGAALDLALDRPHLLGRLARHPRSSSTRCARATSLTPSAEAYVGHAAIPKAPLISPAHADLAGLPPLLIHVGDHETLLDDSTMLAERAAAGGRRRRAAGRAGDDPRAGTCSPAWCPSRMWRWPTLGGWIERRALSAA